MLLIFSNFFQCKGEPGLSFFTFSGSTMGTTFSIQYYADKQKIDTKQIEREVIAVFQEMNNVASLYQKNSEIKRFNQNHSANWIEVTAIFYLLMTTSLAVSEKTGGRFDITILPLLNLFGLGPVRKNITEKFPTLREIEQTRKFIGYKLLQVSNHSNKYWVKKKNTEVQIDYSSLAKGLSVDMVCSVLNQHEVTHFLVEVGGEIRASGNNDGKAHNETIGWNIEIENLNSSVNKPLIIHLKDASLATSGNYRDYVQIQKKLFSHILNPLLVAEAEPKGIQINVASVVATQCMIADAYATAFILMDYSDAMQLANETGLELLLQIKSEKNDIIFRGTSLFEYITRQSR